VFVSARVVCSDEEEKMGSFGEIRAVRQFETLAKAMA
jgi:hypothetical protein